MYMFSLRIGLPILKLDLKPSIFVSVSKLSFFLPRFKGPPRVISVLFGLFSFFFAQGKCNFFLRILVGEFFHKNIGL